MQLARLLPRSIRFCSGFSFRLSQPIHGKTPTLVSADEALDATIKSDTDVYIHSHASTPTELMNALCNIVDKRNLTDIRPVHIILQGEIPWADEKYWGKIRSNCLFLDAPHRKLVTAGLADYTPVFLSDIPRLFKRKVLPVDVALINVSPPDSHGYCSMGVDIECSTAAVSEAKKIVAQVNPGVPRTFGEGVIHISKIDYIVNVDRPIYFKKDNAVANEVEARIGKLIADNLVDNGATLQLGIGAIPDSSLSAMKNHKDLGVHTELLSDGVLDLLDKGIINNQKKTILPGKVVTSFAYGTQRLYNTLNNNPSFHFASCGWTNHVDVIRANSKMTCINSALEVDLTGQIVSDSIGSKFYSVISRDLICEVWGYNLEMAENVTGMRLSKEKTELVSKCINWGFGGQVDFMFGAGTAKDDQGKAIIALTSRTAKGLPKIVPFLKQGAGVVSTRAHVHHIVTEFGIANLWGKNVRQRARALIDIAHPDDREQLDKAAFDRLKTTPTI